MDPLRVEVRVGQQRPDPGPADSLPQGRAELHQVRTWPSTGDCGENHVAAAVDHEDDLRELGVSRGLVVVSALRTTLGVVPAGVPRLQARAIDSRQRDTLLADPVVQRPLEHGVEHPPRRRGRQQSLGRLLEGREVRHCPQPDLAGQVGVVDEMLGQTAVVEVRELLEHQAGQQLGLSELLGAELVAMRRNGLAGGFVGDLQNPARRFACLHIPYYVASSGQVRWISTEQGQRHSAARANPCRRRQLRCDEHISIVPASVAT
jgi:hypothetical protein